MKPTTTENLIQDQLDRIERCNAKKGENLIMDWINDINEEINKSINMKPVLKFDSWMRKIKNVHYSDNDKMLKAYQKIEEPKMNLIKTT